MTDQTQQQEQAAPVDWQAIARQRERELKAVGEDRHRAEQERDEARQHAAAIAAQRDRLRQRMNALADRWDNALAVDKPYARTLRAEISCDPFTADGALAVKPYRADDGSQKWAFRCWGTDTCDGFLSLDHDTERWAKIAQDRHVAEEHTAPAPAATAAAEAAIAPVREVLLFAEQVVATSGPGPASAVQAVLGRLHAVLGAPATVPKICELPHQTIEEEDACERQRVADLGEPAPGPAAAQATDDERDPRQAAYDAVFAYLAHNHHVPRDLVTRNAIIWQAVHAALDATPRTTPDNPAASSGTADNPLSEQYAAAIREHGLMHPDGRVFTGEHDCCADAILAVRDEELDSAAATIATRTVEINRLAGENGRLRQRLQLADAVHRDHLATRDRVQALIDEHRVAVGTHLLEEALDQVGRDGGPSVRECADNDARWPL